jgi:hypothetical protein
VDVFGDEIGSAPSNRDFGTFGAHRLDPRHRAKMLDRSWVVGRHDHGSLGAMSPNELRRRTDVDDTAVVDDCHAVAQPFGFLHEMGRQHHGLATLADAAHQIPDRPPRAADRGQSSIHPGKPVGIVDQRERDKQTPVFDRPTAS